MFCGVNTIREVTFEFVRANFMFNFRIFEDQVKINSKNWDLSRIFNWRTNIAISFYTKS